MRIGKTNERKLEKSRRGRRRDQANWCDGGGANGYGFVSKEDEFLESIMIMFFVVVVAFCVHSTAVAKSPPTSIPDNFVYLDSTLKNAVYDIRYAGTNNFVGQPITGYDDIARIILRRDAAEALVIVEQFLVAKGYALKIFDGYRPQCAVDYFVRWAKDPSDTKMKEVYYPHTEKEALLNGYISEASRHMSGDTVDLTLIDLATGKEIDMGSPFDFFGSISHHDSPCITAEQKNNRETLKNAMLQAGFEPYNKEWWHYSFVSKPRTLGSKHYDEDTTPKPLMPSDRVITILVAFIALMQLIIAVVQLYANWHVIVKPNLKIYWDKRYDDISRNDSSKTWRGCDIYTKELEIDPVENSNEIRLPIFITNQPRWIPLFRPAAHHTTVLAFFPNELEPKRTLRGENCCEDRVFGGGSAGVFAHMKHMFIPAAEKKIYPPFISMISCKESIGVELEFVLPPSKDVSCTYTFKFQVFSNEGDLGIHELNLRVKGTKPESRKTAFGLFSSLALFGNRGWC